MPSMKVRNSTPEDDEIVEAQKDAPLNAYKVVYKDDFDEHQVFIHSTSLSDVIGEPDYITIDDSFEVISIEFWSVM